MIAALFALATIIGPAPALAATPMGPGPDEPAIRISLNNNGRFQRGDKVKLQVKAREDGYLIVLHVDPDRRLRVLFPLDPRDDNFIRGGQKYDIKGRGDRETSRVEANSGTGVVYAAISTDPYRFDEYQVGDHWDFRALNAVQLGKDLEADLNDFVRHIAIRDFDYDLQRYNVYDRALYANSTSYVTDMYYGSGWPSSYSSGWYDDGCFDYWGCGWGGSRLTIGIGIGIGRRGYGRPYWYDPWYYSPVGYYWPPPYYAPVYYYPYYPGYPVQRPYYRPRLPRAGTYAYDYYHGGYYSSPWRRRDANVGASTYAGGRGSFGGGYVPGRLTNGVSGDGGWRNRGVATTPASGNGSTYAPRRATEVRPVDMTPTRGEGRRPGPEVVVVPSDRQPTARPADGRREPRRDVSAPPRNDASEPRRDAAELPRRVGPIGDPRRVDDRPNPPQINPPARDRRETDGFEMPRVIEPRAPARAPEARPADPRTVEPRPADPRATDPRTVEPRPADPRATDPRTVEPRPADPRSADPRTVEPRDVRSFDRQPEPRRVERPAPQPAPQAAPREMNGNGGDRPRAEPRPNMEPARREAPPARAAPPAREREGGGNRRSNRGQ
jgi:hypothetical protein